MHESVEELVEKFGPSEVVLSALGTGSKAGIKRLCSEGTDRIIAAIHGKFPDSSGRAGNAPYRLSITVRTVDLMKSSSIGSRENQRR